MRLELLGILTCPECGDSLGVIHESQLENDELLEGKLGCTKGHSFDVSRGIPRFVSPENYASNFGFQWNKFRQTQLDSYSGIPISANRFWSESGWTRNDLNGATVLDIGCGAGRFSEIALDAGARVVSLDYSSAVDACYENNQRFRSRHAVVQGDIYKLPFKPESFDFVYCFGVLQHTPDVKAGFLALPKMLKPGGGLAVDVYRKHWGNIFHSKYWLRPVTTRLGEERLFRLIEEWVPRLLPLSDFMCRLPGGKLLRRLVPVANYRGLFPLSEVQLREWAILDTYDWFGPRFDQPQTAETIRRWFEGSGLTEIQVLHPAHLTIRGRKPLASKN